MQQGIVENRLRITKEYSREEIWVNLLKRNISEIELQPFQPETIGFIVTSVLKGIMQLYRIGYNKCLTIVMCMYIASSDGEHLPIISYLNDGFKFAGFTVCINLG